MDWKKVPPSAPPPPKGEINTCIADRAKIVAVKITSNEFSAKHYSASNKMHDKLAGRISRLPKPINNRLRNHKTPDVYSLFPVWALINHKNKNALDDGRHISKNYIKTMLSIAKWSLILGIASFPFGLQLFLAFIGLFFTNFPGIIYDFGFMISSWIGSIAIIVGIAALYRLFKNREQYKGTWNAVIGIIIGILDILLIASTFYAGGY